ncbi:protein O-linked-mannose beta-1,2-N-acetylglucosaminyltransferase 1-like [Oratosquilla oratoria]|uniref:protein O-linked-mannose beta-1,2-N-acetylglucosaminyltransferase 1-like n=1 Tax=Oratosquilla oratoria TaxID=337810 RepID=UPI003F76406E
MASSWIDLMWYLSQVNEGHIMLLSVRRSGFRGLRHAKDLLVSLGSILVEHMDSSSLWTWVAVKGGRTLSESLLRRPHDRVFQPFEASLHTETLLPLSTKPLPRATSPLETSRWDFCSSHGALAGLCDEEAPDTLRWSSVPVPGLLSQVPVFIITGKRLQYLYHSLSQLLRCPGAVRENVRAIVGSDASSSVMSLLELLAIPYIKVEAHGLRNHKLFQFYRGAFQSVADKFPSAPAVVFLDEDVYPSPDFFGFLNQTIKILVEDPSLYCISLSSSTIRGRGPQYARRSASQVGWGFALTPSFIREALAQWPDDSLDIEYLYDFWLYENVRGDRECIEPEVARSRHYGLGVNSAAIHEIQSWGSPLLGYSGASIINLHELYLETYQRIIAKDLQRAEVLGPHENPCFPDFVERLSAKPKGTPVVLYYQRENGNFTSNWFFIGWCASFLSYSNQGDHQGVYIAYFPRQERPQIQSPRRPGTKDFNNSQKQTNTLREYPTVNKSLRSLKDLDLRKKLFFSNYNARPSENQEDDLIKVYFVGFPFSFFSSYKPKNSYVYRVDDLDYDTHDAIYDAMQYTPETLNIRETEFRDSVKRLFSL